MSTLTPRDPLAFHVYRLRQSIAGSVNDSKYSDAALVGFLNEAYRSACERAEILRAATTIPIVDGQSVYPLDATIQRVLEVYAAGQLLSPIPPQLAAGAGYGHYYQITGNLILTSQPSGDGSLIVYHLQTPATLSITSTPDPRFGPEWYYLLHHYAAWKILTLIGGARYIRKAVWHRNQFDAGVRLLRHTADTDHTQARRIPVAS